MSHRKVAIVTGALGGIGSVTCKELVKNGYLVIAVCRVRTDEEMAEWRDKYDLTTKDVKSFFMDVTDNQACALGLKAIFQEFGHVEVLINNVGITRDSQFKKMNVEQWNLVINTNLNSLFNMTQPVFQAMCEQGFGRIINISSVNGLKGQFGQTNYSAAKAGMIGFTKALAYEGAGKGVTVNVVAPGYTRTPMVAAMKSEALENITSQIPIKRLAEPSEVAAAIIYLASIDASYITGETLSINGGQYNA